METLRTFALETWRIFLELSPSLLMGLLLAGLVHAFLPRGLVKRRLSANSFRSVFEASLIGVPLPLCSCGVVPAAIGLRNDGASRGAAVSFLISTPQTGLDSLLVSASLLGWPFALFKIGSAFFTGLVGGLLVNATEPAHEPQAAASLEGLMPGREEQGPRLLLALRYALFELLAAIDIYLILGIFAAALIGFLIPPGTLAQMGVAQGFGGMLLVLVLSMALYVCTTSSVPIAAALIAAGLPTGTALVFLMAGPATNIATIGLVYRALGARVLAIYVGTVAVLSLLLGSLFDWVLPSAPAAQLGTPACCVEPSWWEIGSAILLAALLAFLLTRRLLRRFKRPERHLGKDTPMPGTLLFAVEGMTCGHCVARVEASAKALPEVTEAKADLQNGELRVCGTEALLAEPVIAAIEQAGYKARQK